MTHERQSTSRFRSLLSLPGSWITFATGSSALASTMFANAATVLLGFASGVTTARGLTPSGRGVLVGTILSTALVSWLAVSSLDEAIVFGAKGNILRALAIRAELRPIVRRQVFAGLVILAAVVLIVTRHSTRSSAIASVLAGSVILLCNSYTATAAAVFRSAGHYWMWNMTRITPLAFYAIGTTALFFAGSLTSSLGIIALATGCALTALAVRHFLSQLNRATQATPLPEPNDVSVDFRTIRKYGWQLTVFGAPWMVNQRLDQMCLALVLPSAQLGLYSIAIAISGTLQIVAATVEQVLFPRLVGRSVGLLRTSAEVLLAALLISGALAAGLILSMPSIVRVVYGANYLDAVRPAQILTLATVAVVASAPLIAYLKAVNRMRLLITAQVAGLIATAAFLYPALRFSGIRGAAAVSFLAYWLSFVIMLLKLAPPRLLLTRLVRNARDRRVTA